MTLTAYFDDSGRNDPPIITFAGWVAPDEVWETFCDDWVAALAKPPSVTHFRMVDLHHRQGPFSGWSKAQRNSKLSLLAGVVADHNLTGIAIVMQHADHQAAIRGKISTLHDNPYALMLFSSVKEVVLHPMFADKAEQFQFVFDNDLHNKNVLSEVYDSVLPFLPSAISSRLSGRPTHRDDKTEPPLQAADMLAWHIRRCWPRSIDASTAVTTAVPILAKRPIRRLTWTRETLLRLAEAMKSVSHDQGKRTSHEEVRAKNEYVESVSATNLFVLVTTLTGDWNPLCPYPASGTRKYLLVDKCARSGNPHLHTRKENKCLADRTEV